MILFGFTVGTITQASATLAVKPPSLPTIPMMRAPTSLASCRAATKLGETFFSKLPPPTERMKIKSLEFNLLPRNHSTNTLAQPSSLVRAVSSETLSVGA